MLALVLGAGAGCADDQGSTAPVETTGKTEPATTTSATTTTGPGESTGTTTSTTGGMDDLTPWYGMWYSLYPSLLINEPMWWGSGGDGLFFTLFELRADSAIIQVEDCLWGFFQFEYTTTVDEDGVAVLEPVGGEHKFLPHGEIERLYIEPGPDCSSLLVREVLKGGEVGNLFSSSGGPLERGELCLEKCAETQGTQGLISDCGTPVPWQCGG